MTPDMTILIVSIAWFLGGFVNGVSGMGAAMVALPIVAGFMDMSEAVPSSCLVTCIVAGYVAWMYRRSCRMASVWPMLLGCLPGVLAGVWVLKFVPGTWLQAGLGSLLLVYMLWQYLYIPSGRHKESLPSGLLAGFGSGFANAAISFSGPPVVIYALMVGWDKETTRGTLGAFFLAIAIVTCIAQAFAGFFTPSTLTAVAYGIPGAIAGLLVSIPVARKIPEKQFKIVLKLMIAFAGIVCIYRTI